MAKKPGAAAAKPAAKGKEKEAERPRRWRDAERRRLAAGRAAKTGKAKA